jgi:phosphoserine phosphatase
MNPYRVIIFDLDGTLTKPKSLWEYIHRSLGLWENRADRYQERFLSGEISYREFCLLDAGLWKGMELSELETIVDKVEFNSGIEETISHIRSKGLYIALISSGLSILSERVKNRFGIDFAVANELIVKDGRITGEVKIRVTHNGKGKWIKAIGRKFKISPEEMIAIGDSKGDIGMFEMVGFSVAFNSSCRELEDIADICLNTSDLRDIIPLLPLGPSK